MYKFKRNNQSKADWRAQNANVFEQLYEDSQIDINPTPPSKETSPSSTQRSQSEKRPSSSSPIHETKNSKKKKIISNNANAQDEGENPKAPKRTRKSKAR